MRSVEAPKVNREGNPWMEIWNAWTNALSKSRLSLISFTSYFTSLCNYVSKSAANTQPSQCFTPSSRNSYPINYFHPTIKPSNKLHIKIRTVTGKEIDLDIEPHFTILQINELVEADSGIPPDQQWLIAGARKIDKDQTQAAKNCQIQDGATLNLVLTSSGGVGAGPLAMEARSQPVKMRIKIQKLNGESMMIVINPDFTIQQIQDLAESELGSPYLRHRLQIEGEVLEESRTAASYNLKDGQKVKMMFHSDARHRSPEHDSFWRTKRCKYFAQNRCSRGEHCNFLHERAEEQIDGDDEEDVA